MDQDSLLSRGSRFADSPPLLAKVDATYSLLTEVAEHNPHVPAPVRSALPHWPGADDPVVRRSLDLMLVAMKNGDPVADAVAEPAAPGFRPLPRAKDEGVDDRVAVLHSPGETPLAVLTAADDADPWTAALRRLFTDVLGNPGQVYDIVAATGAEVAGLQAAADLLSSTLPQVARSVLSHTSLIVLVEGPDAFESATDRRIPRAVFISRAALADPVRTAEALLHESVHQKLYDLQLIYQLYRPGYDADRAGTVEPPWHEGRAQWSFDRGVAACHVYTHLHAFFAALPPQTTSVVDISGSTRQAAERALFLHGALTPLAPYESNASGRAFIAWIGECQSAIS